MPLGIDLSLTSLGFSMIENIDTCSLIKITSIKTIHLTQIIHRKLERVQVVLISKAFIKFEGILRSVHQKFDVRIRIKRT